MRLGSERFVDWILLWVIENQKVITMAKLISDYFKDGTISVYIMKIVNWIDELVMSLFLTEEEVDFNSDSILKTNDEIGIQLDWLSTEFLNNIRCSRLPDH